jgi:putative tryptophan/tyrosine transport system substrate-binding protein
LLAAAAWPLAVRAQQQSERVRRIGVLMGLNENYTGGQAEVAALKRGLQELGWTESRNLEVKYSWSGAEVDRIQTSAKEFVGLQRELIVARGAPVLRALLRETR